MKVVALGPSAVSNLILGASSGIARALVKQLLADGEEVFAVSRSQSEFAAKGLHTYESDNSEQSVAEIAAALKNQPFARVFICHGVLHGENFMPEKRLEDISQETMETVIKVNTLTPLLWLKHLKPSLKGDQKCVVTVFSARIGSISDNNLGGWYAYRASKAALNMLVRNCAIEYARTSKQTRFLLFHPGTTDTTLSKPFQKSVPADKLFTPQFVAERLLQLTADIGFEPGIDYLDFNGEAIQW